MAADFARHYRRLTEAKIKFILIGGGAATLHGVARLTLDVDVLYAQEDDDRRRIVDGLAPINPDLREASPGSLQT